MASQRSPSRTIPPSAISVVTKRVAVPGLPAARTKISWATGGGKGTPPAWAWANARIFSSLSGSRTTERKLDSIMTGIHQATWETAEEFGAPGNYVVGANITGFIRVAKAMLALGLI